MIRAKTHYASLLLISFAAYFALVAPVYAVAAEPPKSVFDQIAGFLFSGLEPIERVLCTILLLILGDIGRGIATLAVMSVGIGAMLGKVTWGQAMTVAVGIAIMFGAPLILPLLFMQIGNFGVDFVANIPCLPPITP